MAVAVAVITIIKEMVYSGVLPSTVRVMHEKLCFTPTLIKWIGIMPQNELAYPFVVLRIN